MSGNNKRSNRSASSRLAFSAAAAIVASALGAGSLFAASVVDLSITANNGVWNAYINVQDPATLGLAGIQFDITGNGILLNNVTGANNKLPTGIFTDTNGNPVSSGFVLLRSATLVGNDVSFTGGQSLTYDNEDSATPAHDNLVKGFGMPGTTTANAGDQVKTFGDPALLATGTYTGNGTITISGDFASTSLLPASLPADSAPIVTHSPDPSSVNGQTTLATSSTPEPASTTLAGLAAIGLLSSRRRRTA
ncbi:MAG TPA: PEP-CTERM sorting domain-containing protein [Tepidisphaeraceae bacterium]|nr:PEP-CTERM sorting domain-containing protein [Tepidisphaeraceae bacterium]